ncbi:hypothetical protein [Xanthobacter autotrophicus]|uniref:hypothetical protein n=1 Tax=Xanthobacter autotrophicus TaxID=280 RepID=UPI0024A7725F|nr:hypothetical protein [Xanthobacter autotrophicus]MDI4658396.1 hypothetical protein [Xanthobacter autotrophicus]
MRRVKRALQLAGSAVAMLLLLPAFASALEPQDRPGFCGCPGSEALSGWKLSYLRAMFQGCDETVVAPVYGPKGGWHSYGAIDDVDRPMLLRLPTVLRVARASEILMYDLQRPHQPSIVFYTEDRLAKFLRPVVGTARVFTNIGNSHFTTDFNFFISDRAEGLAELRKRFLPDEARDIAFDVADGCRVHQIMNGPWILATLTLDARSPPISRCAVTAALMHYGFRGYSYLYSSDLTETGSTIEVPVEVQERWSRIAGPQTERFQPDPGAPVCQVVEELVSWQ